MVSGIYKLCSLPSDDELSDFESVIAEPWLRHNVQRSGLLNTLATSGEEIGERGK
jgi:hypothetical protein